MIPAINESGVLPPFLPAYGPADPAAMSPYTASMTEIATRFAITAERKAILMGLLGYRQALRDAGITDGFQWVDGSYLEECERDRGHAPNDIDIVTFAERPNAAVDDASWAVFFAQNKTTLFDPNAIKKAYRCDAYYQDLDLPAKIIVSRVRYWFGLFSHRRLTYLWKGLLQIPLQDDDQAALDLLSGGAHNAP